MYKILTKILSNKIKKVLGGIIDCRQCAFLGGRYLLHSALVANKVVEEAKRKKKKCLIFKVDYKKSYDSVSWKFLLYMLKRLGFQEKWIGWIRSYLVSSKMSVLVNECPTCEFGISGGLRQGDSLIPFLFNIMAEGLTDLMR